MKSLPKTLRVFSLAISTSAALLIASSVVHQTPSEARPFGVAQVGKINTYQPVWTDGQPFYIRIEYGSSGDCDKYTGSKSSYRVTYTDAQTKKSIDWKDWKLKGKKGARATIWVTAKDPNVKASPQSPDPFLGTGSATVILTQGGMDIPAGIGGTLEDLEHE
jgi:hypothetical protein